MLNLGGVVNALSSSSVTRRRFAAGTITNGIYTKGTSADSTITVCLSAPPARELQLQPEGIRSRARYLCHSTADIRTADEGARLLADEITIDGRRHEAVECADRSAIHGGFRRVLLVEIPTGET